MNTGIDIRVETDIGEAWRAAAKGGQPEVWRVTLTYAVLNLAPGSFSWPAVPAKPPWSAGC